tara:strand:- start:970 stop:1773 length:804 start_codon:yes stop_codon:yes gene_type:complete
MSDKHFQKLWVVSDIDGTLMDHQYDLTPALDTIRILKEKEIPLILCTSKTASEVREIRNEIGLADPFIVENGAAIYGNKDDSSGEWELILGRSYQELRTILEELSREIDYKLRALNDLSYMEIEELTGLKYSDIELALDRHWSVPFLNPPKEYIEELSKLTIKYNINIYQGNRMSHLLDKNSHKGKAVLKLKNFLNSNSAYVVALGDSQNDIPLLKVADKAIVVPSLSGVNKSLEKGIKEGAFELAPAPHSTGWAIAVQELIDSHSN